MNKKIEKSINVYYSDKKYLKILDELETLKVEKIFKDNQRSKVFLFKFLDERLVFKIPKEKNTRKWQRFLSIFRGSESYREYIQCEKIKKSGFKTYDPILVFEKKKWGIVVESFFICSFLEGKTGSIKELESIKKELWKVHKNGYLHGDAQLVNFIVDKELVYLIDSKFKKNIYGGFGKASEYICLEESCGKKIEYDKESVYYKIAKNINTFFNKLSKFRKKLK